MRRRRRLLVLRVVYQALQVLMLVLLHPQCLNSSPNDNKDRIVDL